MTAASVAASHPISTLRYPPTPECVAQQASGARRRIYRSSAAGCTRQRTSESSRISERRRLSATTQGNNVTAVEVADSPVNPWGSIFWDKPKEWDLKDRPCYCGWAPIRGPAAPAAQGSRADLPFASLSARTLTKRAHVVRFARRSMQARPGTRLFTSSNVASKSLSIRVASVPLSSFKR